jgi:hypothetical protein
VKKYRVVGSYTQWFYVDIEAEDEEQAREIALSGDEDMKLTDCDYWLIHNIIGDKS